MVSVILSDKHEKNSPKVKCVARVWNFTQICIHMNGDDCVSSMNYSKMLVFLVWMNYSKYRLWFRFGLLLLFWITYFCYFWWKLDRVTVFNITMLHGFELTIELIIIGERKKGKIFTFCFDEVNFSSTLLFN